MARYRGSFSIDQLLTGTVARRPSTAGGRVPIGRFKASRREFAYNESWPLTPFLPAIPLGAEVPLPFRASQLHR